MIALLAGTGALPAEIAARLARDGAAPLICELEGFASEVDPALPRLAFRLETLGTFVARLVDLGVTRLCLAGAIRRPPVDPARIDAATLPLAPRIAAALGRGDDGALREALAIFEEAGIAIVAAHEVAPDLLPHESVLTRAQPGPDHATAAALGDRTVADMGRRDSGQACLIRGDVVVAEEGPDGTDAMLARFVPDAAQVGDRRADAGGALLFKAPKPQQDRRVDLPVIGPATARRCVEARLAGVVIEAGGVILLDRDEVLRILDRDGLFLWVRPRGSA